MTTEGEREPTSCGDVPLHRRAGPTHRFSTRDGRLTVLDRLDLEVAAGGYVTLLAGAGPRARRRRAGELLDAVGLAARADHRPGELSGGERQRVAIARALANRPQVVLADELTGNLDDDSATMVIELLESLPAEHGCTLVVVTHNRGLARRAMRLMNLAGGRLREVAPV